MNEKKKHISLVASARFAAAVRDSLDRLIKTRQEFSVSDVIANASYEDGSKVGATTIYAKTSGGELVHGKLLASLKAAAVASRSRSAKGLVDAPGRPGSFVEAALLKQLVEQEGRLQEAEAATATLRHLVANSQERQFVMLECLNILCRGGVLDIARPLRELEGVIGDARLLAKLKDEAHRLAATCGRLVRIK